MMPVQSRKGFTLLEILIVMALIAILAGIVIAAINPARQFANARNSTRYAHLNTIMNAINANMVEHNGSFSCVTGALPATATDMGVAAPGYDIGPCLVTTYVSSMPFDPSVTGAHWTSTTDYDTGYTIMQGADGRITVTAPAAENGVSISMTR